MPKHPLRVGLIGCGDIARKAYLPFAQNRSEYRITSCTDIRTDVADALAKDFNLKCAPSPEEILSDPDIEIILNLTHPAAHAEVNRLALEHGKHVYCEKPFALTLDEGQAVLELAQSRGLMVGCAPDTVLGAGTQTARAAVEQGLIGRPIAARLMWCCGGHESWHPNPAFYYQQGGGPMLDMGPYYLSALVNILGPLKSVMGRTAQGSPTRTITSQPLHGTRIDVDVPTHVSGVIETQSGVQALTLMSFDMPGRGDFSHMPEIIGTEGTLKSSDPNAFDGTIYIRRAGEKDYQELPATHHYEGGRGLGLADMARAIQGGRVLRASGELACHILEAMLAFERSEQSGARIDLVTTCRQPLAMPEAGFAD